MTSTFFAAQEGSSKSLHLDINRDDDQVVVASNTVFRIYKIEDNRFVERLNLRGTKSVNLNYSCNDVCWSKHDSNVIATAATNGAVVLWNLARPKKQEHVFSEHTRAVNKVTFHPTEANYLLSGSQDGSLTLFDCRIHDSVGSFYTNTPSVRDVSFAPHDCNEIVVGTESGQLQLWDVRKFDKCTKKWPAHNDHIFAVDWHPESRYTLASAGRDKQIKIWNTKDATLEYFVHSIGPVGKIKWRPRYNFHIASCSGLVGDFSINVWDVRRPYLPLAIFAEHRNVATDIAWLQDSDRLLSGGKDNLIHHNFADSSRPALKANPAGLAINTHGHISHAFRDGTYTISASSSTLSGLPDVVPRTPQSTPTESFRISSFFTNKPQEKDLFLSCQSELKYYNEEALQLWTGTEHIAQCARNYKLSGGPFEYLCEHNAKVCIAANKRQVAETWRLLSLVVKDPLELFLNAEPTLSSRMFSSGVQSSDNRFNIDERGDDKDGKLAEVNHGKLRRSSASNSEARFHHISNPESREKNVGSGDEEEEDYDYAENELTLTNIASGQMLTGGICNDFFGDSEIGEIELETFVATSSNNADTRWELKSEAFEPRVNLNDELPEEEDVQDRFESSGIGQEDNVDSQHIGTHEEMSGQATELVVVDQTSSLLCVDTALVRPSWTSNTIIRDTLLQFAEHGDVQTAISMYMVLRLQRNNYRNIIDDQTLEYWFNAYIELLHRLQLFNNASCLIKMCTFLPEIHNMTQQSTTVLSNCTRCNKALSRSQGSWWCERCQKTPNLCCLCQKLVKGLFAWCQGCSHGGHLRCLKMWYQKNTLCPTGCGHHCEYQ